MVGRRHGGPWWTAGERVVTGGAGSVHAVFAYLDAASGSMIVSAVAAGAAGIGVAARMGLRKAKRKLRLGDGGTGATSEAQPET